MDTTTKVTHKAEWRLYNFTKENLQSKTFKGVCSQSFEIRIQEKVLRGYIKLFTMGKSLGVYLAFLTNYQDDYRVKYKFWMAKNENETTRKGEKALSDFEAHRGHILFYNYPKFVRDSTIYLEDDNSLIIGLKVKVYRENSTRPFTLDAGHFFNAEKWSDILISCSDGQNLPAHKLILSSNSEIIDKMLESQLNEDVCRVIFIDDIDSETMLEILRFMYTRKVNNLQALDTKILYGAEKYGLDELKSLCVSSMITNISVNNVVEYLILADRSNEEYLFKKCAKFIKLNYSRIRGSPEWKKIDHKLHLALMDSFSKNTRHIHYFTSTL